MNFPLLYDTHYSHHLEDLPLWSDLAGQQGNPILELGCGSGRILLPLIEAGYRAFGLDNDLAMLSLVKEKVASEKPSGGVDTVPIFQADLRSFHLNTHFKLILLPCNTWSTFDPQERAKALECISFHLSQNGVFATSVPNPTLLLDLPRKSEAEFEESFTHPLSGNPVQVSSGWERAGELFTVSWYYDHLMPDGGVERLVVEASHHLSNTSAYQDELLAAGLQISNLWGDFDGSAYSTDSAHLILAAKKK